MSIVTLALAIIAIAELIGIIYLLGRICTPLPTTIQFKEQSMNPTAAGQTQTYTGTLSPEGSAFPSDAVFTVTSNDTLVSPTVDATGLVVSVTYPDGWNESISTPLEFAYSSSSAANPNWTLSATITPSAPVSNFPTSILFVKTS